MKGKLLAIIAVFCSLAGLTACGEDKTHEHSWDKGNVTLQATCVSDGLKVYTCTECNATKEEVIEAMGHAESAEVKRNAEEATCTQSGSYDSTVYCLVCGEIISNKKTEIEAKGHTPATAVKENETAASCIEAGSYDSVVYCADCHAELERNTVTGEYGEHSWDSGVVISERTLTSDGLMRYTCNVCEDTNDVVIPKGADFSEDFTIEEGGAWKYGYVNYQWGEREDFEFVSATSDGISAWKADGTEIKDGWIDFGAMTTLGYAVGKSGTVNATISFTGGTELTRVALRVGVKSQGGMLYSNPVFCGGTDNKLNANLNLNVFGGDTIYFIFSNEASGTEGAYPNGDLSIKLDYKQPIADFSDDFTLEEGGAWKYGYVNYQWGEREDFEFVSATSDGISAWKADGTEIKNGWIDFGAMTTIGYTAETDGAVKLKIRFTGGTALTRAALRIGVKNADGVLYSNPAFHASELNVISLEREFNLKAGDTIYLIFSNEAGGTEGAYPNGDLDITVLQ